MKADTKKTRYWLGVASRDHVLLGIKGSFAMMNHGKEAPLKRIHKGDGLVYYSPRIHYPDGPALQAFTAIGTARGGEPYQADMGDGFKPFRIDVDFLPCQETPIKPLLGELTFTRDRPTWGSAFRFGSFEIEAEDFTLIKEKMGCGQLAYSL